MRSKLAPPVAVAPAHRPGPAGALRRAAVFAGALVVASALPAVALAGGDVEAGKALSATCAACHAAVAPTGDTPQLAGQREVYIAKQLKAFKNGDRKNKGMAAIATQMSDADIANAAAFWASQPSGSDSTVSPEVAALRKPQMTTFPKDFPKGFVHYHSWNGIEAGVVNQAYVNAVGLQAAKAGKPLPDGTQIIVVKSTPKLDASKKPLIDASGFWLPDTLKSFSTMEARAGWGKHLPELLRNGNWSYGVFGADRAPVATTNQAPCLGCHRPLTSTSFVFTLEQMKAKAAGK